MKRSLKVTLFGIMASVFVLLALALGVQNVAAFDKDDVVPGDWFSGISIVDENPQPFDNQVDEQEIADILWMREEEKLARDVYLTLGEKWGLSIFTNISKSEQKHMDSMLTLVERYGITDPVGDNGVGEFTNTDIQALYNQLIARGNTSAAEALLVGGIIEEIDMIDLENAIARTNNEDIRLVYSGLKCGSGNHLRGFSRTYEQQTGLQYEPQVLDQAVYDAIISSSHDSCTMPLKYFLPLTIQS